jgi:hypothetical protein
MVFTYITTSGAERFPTDSRNADDATLRAEVVRSQEERGHSETGGHLLGESISQGRRVSKVAREAKRQGTPEEAGGSLADPPRARSLERSEGQGEQLAAQLKVEGVGTPSRGGAGRS